MISISNAFPAGAPRLAVSVLMARGKGPNLEVFVQHRTLTMDFAAGVVVFPGGVAGDLRSAAGRRGAGD